MASWHHTLTNLPISPPRFRFTETTVVQSRDSFDLTGSVHIMLHFLHGTWIVEEKGRIDSVSFSARYQPLELWSSIRAHNGLRQG